MGIILKYILAIKIDRIFLSLIFILYTLAVIYDLKTFTVWSQVAPAVANKTSYYGLFTIAAAGNVHTPRITLVYLVFMIADNSFIDRYLFYSLFVMCLLFLIYHLNRSILNQFIPKGSRAHYFILFAYLTLSIFMNGRGVFSHFGITLLMYSFIHYRFTEKLSNIAFVILTPISLFFLSVSTGTFSVGYIAALLFSVLDCISPNKRTISTSKKRHYFLIPYIFFISYIFLPLFTKGIQKNLDFYDSSFYKMLAHGPGMVITEFAPLILILLAIAVFYCKNIVIYLITNRPFLLIASFLISSFTIGLFGYSSLTLSIPSILILLCIFTSNLYSSYTALVGSINPRKFKTSRN